jgi:hypothetical protein
MGSSTVRVLGLLAGIVSVVVGGGGILKSEVWDYRRERLFGVWPLRQGSCYNGISGVLAVVA